RPLPRRPATHPSTGRRSSRMEWLCCRHSSRASIHAALEPQESAMTDDTHVPRCQLQRSADLFRVAILDEGLEHDCAIARLELARAILETPAIRPHPRRLEAERELQGNAFCDAPLPRLASSHIHHCVTTSAEYVGVEASRILDSTFSQRRKHGQQDMLHEILGGGGIAKMTESVGTDAIRVALTDASLCCVLHGDPR